MGYQDPRPEGLNTDPAPDSIVETLKVSDLKTVTFDASQWQLVPKVPTPAMLHEAKITDDITNEGIYAAMLAAAPTAVAQSAGQEAVAYEHVLHMEGDQTEERLTYSEATPFGMQGTDYDSAYSVTCRPLVYGDAAPVNGGERELGQVIDERDQYHDAAEKLADAIAKHFGVEIGEHSNLNCPWQNAFDHIAQATKRVADAPQVGGDEREAFEHAERASNLQRDDEGDYVNPCVQSSWEGWQARAALSADGGEDKREIPDLPPPPDNVLADMQVTVDRLKMWAKGEAHYAPANGYDDPGVKKATISDVKKSAGYFAKRLEESYFSLRDFLFAMDQIRAAIAANQARKEGA